MDADAADLARRLALRLGGGEPDLLPLVEDALGEEQAPSSARQFGAEWVDLAGLIITVIGTLYPIIKDWRRGERATLRERLNKALDERDLPRTDQRAEVVEALLDELDNTSS